MIAAHLRVGGYRAQTCINSFQFQEKSFIGKSYIPKQESRTNLQLSHTTTG